MIWAVLLVTGAVLYVLCFRRDPLVEEIKWLRAEQEQEQQ